MCIASAGDSGLSIGLRMFLLYFRAIVQKAASYSHLDVCSRCLPLLRRVPVTNISSVRLTAHENGYDSLCRVTLHQTLHLTTYVTLVAVGIIALYP